uniref:SRPBCC family protein n=1 Tax=Stappia sp. TaxID=1870903 RepID=UPI003BA854F0
MKTMTGNDPFATLIEPATLKIERRLPGPVERVWECLTQSDLRARWLAAGDMDLRPGAPFTFTWRNDDLSASASERPQGTPEVMTMESRIIEVHPPVRLVFSWEEGGEVAIDLSPDGGDVLLRLIHRRVVKPGERLMIAAGWHMHLDILRAVLAEEIPPSFWAGWMTLKEAYAERFPA